MAQWGFSTPEMQTAWQLKSNGWQHVLYNTDLPALAEMTKWCRDSFGLMYGRTDTDGKWFGAVMRFGDQDKPQMVLMFPEKEYAWFLLRWA